MLKAELQQHMEARGLELTDPRTQKDKTREKMILEIKLFEAQAQSGEEPNATSLATPRTKEDQATGQTGDVEGDFVMAAAFPDTNPSWGFGGEQASSSAGASRQPATQRSKQNERSARLFAEMEAIAGQMDRPRRERFTQMMAMLEAQLPNRR
jgi:hypothetical protein